MRNNSYSFATLIFGAIAFFTIINISCNKNEEIHNTTTQKESFTIEQKNANIELLGQAVGRLLVDNIAFRYFVYEKVLEKVTQDFDIPIEFIRKEKVDGVIIEELINNEIVKINSFVNLNGILESLHWVQLTIPILLIDKWNPEIAPSIVILPVDKNHKQVESYVGFDINGKKKYFCPIELPVEQVVVIRESDRIDKAGKLLVDKHGVVTSTEHRHCISEVKKLNDEYIRQSSKNIKYNDDRLIEILSEDSMAVLILKHKQHRAEIQSKLTENEKKLKELIVRNSKTSTPRITNELKSFSNQPKTIVLTWTGVGESNVTFKVLANGKFPSNILDPNNRTRVPVYLPVNEERIIAETSSLNAVCILPYGSEVYNIIVKGYKNGEEISTSNYVSTYTSLRAQGCMEHPLKISMTAKLMRSLEGWAPSDIELSFVISSSDANNNPKQEVRGGVEIKPNYRFLTLQDTERFYCSNTFPLFRWNKYEFNNGGFTSSNGIYSIAWYEYDFNEQDWLQKLKTFVVKSVIGYVGGSTIPVLSEAVTAIADLDYKINKSDNPIGYTLVNWWDPQESSHIPMPGMHIVMGFSNPGENNCGGYNGPSPR